MYMNKTLYVRRVFLTTHDNYWLVVITYGFWRSLDFCIGPLRLSLTQSCQQLLNN
jgi:hypothetical protein